MNPIWGWALAVAAVVAGWAAYGWPGVVMAVSVVVFWLLLQFSRLMRVMKRAASAPVGHVDSAVMLNARLHAGYTLMQVVKLTRSLGERVSETPESWAWADDGGSRVTLVFDARARLSLWTLTRPDEPPPL